MTLNRKLLFRKQLTCHRLNPINGDTTVTDGDACSFPVAPNPTKPDVAIDLLTTDMPLFPIDRWENATYFRTETSRRERFVAIVGAEFPVAVIRFRNHHHAFWITSKRLSNETSRGVVFIAIVFDRHFAKPGFRESSLLSQPRESAYSPQEHALEFSGMFPPPWLVHVLDAI